MDEHARIMCVSMWAATCHHSENVRKTLEQSEYPQSLSKMLVNSAFSVSRGFLWPVHPMLGMLFESDEESFCQDFARSLTTGS